MSENEKVPDEKRLFRVHHDNGDIIKGFDDLASARDDATERTRRAEECGLACRYHAAARQ